MAQSKVGDHLFRRLVAYQEQTDTSNRLITLQGVANPFLKGWSLRLWSKSISSKPKDVCGRLTCCWVGKEHKTQNHAQEDLQHASFSNRFSIRPTRRSLKDAPLDVLTPLAFRTSQILLLLLPDSLNGTMTPATFWAS